MHVIFCRNVLIYFGDQLKHRVLGLFADGLSRGGFLCLGASEALPAHRRDQFHEISPQLRIYQYRSEP
jgi:chemotaxis protein methyltransferase CheR